MDIRVERPKWGENYDVGCVGFTVTRGQFVSAGISWFQRWDDIPSVPAPTHCFVITGEDETVEAFARGVARGKLSAYVEDRDVCLLVRRPRKWTPELGRLVAGEAAQFIGQRYGYALVAAHAVANSYLGRLLGWATRGRFERWMVSATDGAREQMCSELAARSLQAADSLKWRGVLSWSPAQVKPVDLFLDRLCFEPPSGAVELVPAL